MMPGTIVISLELCPYCNKRHDSLELVADRATGEFIDYGAECPNTGKWIDLSIRSNE